MYTYNDDGSILQMIFISLFSSIVWADAFSTESSQMTFFQSTAFLKILEAKMIDRWSDECKCYLIQDLDKVFVNYYVSFQAGQWFADFIANEASGIYSPQKRFCSHFSWDFMWATYPTFERSIQSQTLHLQAGSWTWESALFPFSAVA